MKTISVSVSESDYEAFRAYAARHDRSIAELVREAMAFYRLERLAPTEPLEQIPVFSRPKPRRGLPSREEVYDELAGGRFDR